VINHVVKRFYSLLVLLLLLLFVSCDLPVYKVDDFVPRIREHPTEADKDFNEGLALFLLSGGRNPRMPWGVP